MKPLVEYEWLEGRSKQVAYISQDHHIHELVPAVKLLLSVAGN